MSSQGPSPRLHTVRKDRVPAKTRRFVNIRTKTPKKAALKTAKPSRKPSCNWFEQDVIEFCRDHMAVYKAARYVEFIRRLAAQPRRQGAEERVEVNRAGAKKVA